MEINNIKIDSSIAEQGDWVDAAVEGVRLKVRGLRSRAYRDSFARRSKLVPNIGRARDGTLLPSSEDRVRNAALADAVLLDWAGLTEGGESLPYSRERAFDLLADASLEFLGGLVVLAAAQIDDRATASLAEPPGGGA